MESFKGVIANMDNMSHIHCFCTLVKYQENVKLLYRVPCGDCVFKLCNIEGEDDAIDMAPIEK